MGFYVIKDDLTDTAQPLETLTRGRRLQGPGFRSYSPSLGRWLSRGKRRSRPA